MNKGKLLVIISVTAGAQNDVADEIKQLLESYKQQYDVETISKPPELGKLSKKLHLNEFSAAAVYGGDGTIIEAIKVFGEQQLPVIILRGGTANILASYFKMPTALESLELYLKSTLVSMRTDIATVNGDLLVLDMHAGWWTESIKETPRDLKKKIGPSAYAWSAFRKANTAQLQKYEFTLNDRIEHKTEGYTFLIANQGNQHVLGLPIFPRDHAPGMIQIAVLKDIKPSSLLRWFARRMVGKNTDSVIQIYRAKKATITRSPEYVLSDDDSKKIKLPIKVVAGEHSAKLLVLPARADVHVMTKLYRWLELWVHRLILRTKTILNAGPSLRYSHVAPNLYLGGKYPSSTYNLFREWGITGVVSMRRTASAPAPKDIEVLHLPTQDWTPPSIENLVKGAEFINQKIADGGSVYVHCRLGEGRGPTMAAAYLISNGFTVEEALVQLSKYRPVASPNARQRKRLAELQEHYNSKK